MADQPQSTMLNGDAVGFSHMSDEDGRDPVEVTSVVIEKISGQKRPYRDCESYCESCGAELPPAKKFALDVASAMLTKDEKVPQQDHPMEGYLKMSADANMARFAELILGCF